VVTRARAACPAQSGRTSFGNAPCPEICLPATRAETPIYRDLALAALPFAVEKGARAHDQSQAIRHLIAQYK
jgi:hypothetical protein